MDDVYHIVSDLMDQAIALRRAGDWKRMWIADLDEWGSPISINENPDGEGVYDYRLRLPGQTTLTAAEGGQSATAGGLVENWHRVHDSSVGKYVRRDPSGWSGKHLRLDPQAAREADPQFYNPYPYVGGRVLAYVDPNGQWPWRWPRIMHRAIREAQTTSLTGPDGGPQDAFRHCLASCYGMSEVWPFPRVQGWSGGIWRELRFDNTWEDMLMDFDNNAFGRALGCGTDDCYSMCMNALELGLLTVVEPPNSGLCGYGNCPPPNGAESGEPLPAVFDLFH